MFYIQQLPTHPDPHRTLFLQDAAGNPVWPVVDEPSQAVLNYVAQLYGGEPLPVAEALPIPEGQSVLPGKDVPSLSPTEEAPGIVAGIGPAKADLVRLYAHLTGRQAKVLSHWEELKDQPFPHVLLATFDEVTEELLDVLYPYEFQHSHVVGLICTETVEKLFYQVLAKSAAARLRTSVQARRILIYPSLDVDHFQSTGLDLLGAGADKSVVKSALGHGAGLLWLKTHSDGLDTSLGKEHILCPVMPGYQEGAQLALADQDPAQTNLPRCCIDYDVCHRLKMPIQQAWEEGALFPPEGCRARIFYYGVCWGYLNQGGAYDPRWGLGRRLIENPGIGALITSRYILSTEQYEDLTLEELLNQGTPVGEGLLALNRLFQKDKQSLILFGDPRVCLPVPEDGHVGMDFYGHIQPMVNTTNATLQTDPQSNLPSSLRWAGLLVEQLKLGNIKAHEAEAFQDVVAVLEKFNVEYPSTLTPSNLTPLTQQLLSALMTFFAVRKKALFQEWALLSIRTQITLGICSNCGATAHEYVETLQHTPQLLRRYIQCIHCRVVEDTPPDHSLTLVVNFEGIGFKTTLPMEEWHGTLIIAADEESESLVVDWPALPSRAPQPMVPFPASRPKGPIRLFLFIKSGNDVAYATYVVPTTAFPQWN